MLLCNGHAVSKSIRKEKRVDELFDNLNDVEATTGFVRRKHDRIYGKLEREPDAPVEARPDERTRELYGDLKKETDAATKTQTSERIRETTAGVTERREETSIAALRSPKEVGVQTVTAKYDHPSKSKRKLFRFWKRKKNKKQKYFKSSTQAFYSSTVSIQKPFEPKRDASMRLLDLDHFEIGERPIQGNTFLHVNDDETHDIKEDSYEDVKEMDLGEFFDNRRKRYSNIKAPKAKRRQQSKTDVTHDAGKKGETKTRALSTATSKSQATEKTTPKRHTARTNKTTTKSTTKLTTKPTSTKSPSTMSTLNNVISRLEDEIKKMQSSEASVQKDIKYSPSTLNIKTYETTQFVTDGIEELLNQLKNKQNQYASIESPSLANLIMSTVTTAAFEGDGPMSQTTHAYGFSTMAARSNYVEQDKNLAPILEKTNLQKAKMESATENPEFDSKVLIHSVATEIPTFADYIRRQSSYSKKCNFMDKIKKIFTVSTQMPIPTPNREYNFTPVPLVKHDLNGQKLQFLNNERQIRSTSRMSKRSDETMLSERELNIDDFEFPESIEIPEPSVMPDDDVIPKPFEAIEPVEIPESVDITESVGQPGSDYVKSSTVSMPDLGNNVEDINRKVWHSDYVNGYKYYLEYQKEFKNDNFSAQVKYQAHRHHKVDDIGKFILDKIPTVTDRNRRLADEIMDKPTTKSTELTLSTSKNTNIKENLNYSMPENIAPVQKKDTSREIQMDVLGTRKTQIEDENVDDLYEILQDKRTTFKTTKEKNKLAELSMGVDQTTEKSALKQSFYKILGQSAAKKEIKRSIRDKYKYAPDPSLGRTTKASIYVNNEGGPHWLINGHGTSADNATYEPERPFEVNSATERVEKGGDYESKSMTTISHNRTNNDRTEKRKFKFFERLKFKKRSKSKRSKRQQERIKKNPLKKLKTWLRGRQNQKAEVPKEQTTEESKEKETTVKEEPALNTPITKIIPNEKGQNFDSAEATDVRSSARTSEAYQFTADHEKSSQVGIANDKYLPTSATPSHPDDTHELENILVNRQNYLLNKGLLDRKIVEQVPDDNVNEKDLATSSTEKNYSREEQRGDANEAEDLNFVMEAEIEKNENSVYQTVASSHQSDIASNGNTVSMVKPSTLIKEDEFNDLDYSWSIVDIKEKPESLLETSVSNLESEIIAENNAPVFDTVKAYKKVNSRRELENLLGMKQINANDFLFKKIFNDNAEIDMQDLSIVDSETQTGESFDNLDDVLNAKKHKLQKQYKETVATEKFTLDTTEKMKSINKIDNALDKKGEYLQNLSNEGSIEFKPASHLEAQYLPFATAATIKTFDFLTNRNNLINSKVDRKHKQYYGMTSTPEETNPENGESLNSDIKEIDELLRDRLKAIQNSLKKDKSIADLESDFQTKTEPFSTTTTTATKHELSNFFDATQKEPENRYDEMLSVADSSLNMDGAFSASSKTTSSSKTGNSINDLDYLLDIREKELEYLLDKSTSFPLTEGIKDLKPTAYSITTKNFNGLHEFDELLQTKQKGILNLFKITRPYSESKYNSDEKKLNFISTTLNERHEDSDIYDLERLLSAKLKDIQNAFHFPSFDFKAKKNMSTSHSTMYIPADYNSNQMTLPAKDNSGFRNKEYKLGESTQEKLRTYATLQKSTQTKKHHFEKPIFSQTSSTGASKSSFITQIKAETLQKTTSLSSRRNTEAVESATKAKDQKQNKFKDERVSEKVTQKRSIGPSTIGSKNMRNIADILKEMDMLVRKFKPTDSEHFSTTRSYDDYFNDLMIWHGDILDSETRKSTVNWEKVLREIEPLSPSPSPTLLRKELSDLNELVHDTKATTEKSFKNSYPKANANARSKFVRSIMFDKGMMGYGLENTLEKPAPERYLVKSNSELDIGLPQGIGQSTVEESDDLQNLKYRDRQQWSLNLGPTNFKETTMSMGEKFDYSYVLKGNPIVREHRWSKNHKNDKNVTKTKTSARSWLTSFHGKSQPQANSDESETYPLETYPKAVPMRDNEFETFLKENSLDLGSVTAPLADVGKYVDTWSPRMNSFTFMPHSETATHGKVSTSYKPLAAKTLATGEDAVMTTSRDNATLTNTPAPYSSSEATTAKLLPERSTVKTSGVTTKIRKNDEGKATADKSSYNMDVLLHQEDFKNYLIDGSNFVFDNEDGKVEMEDGVEQNSLQLEILDIGIKKSKHSLRNGKTLFHKPHKDIPTLNSNESDRGVTSQPEDLEITVTEMENNKYNQNKPFTTSKTFAITDVDIQYEKTQPEKKSESKNSKSNESDASEADLSIKLFNDKNQKERSGADIKKSKNASELDEVFKMSNFFGNEKNVVTLSPDYPGDIMSLEEKKTTTHEVQQKEKKTPVKKKPHRFHVSSHSYRYDIVYEEAPEDQDDKFISRHISKLTTRPWLEVTTRSNSDNKNYDSEFVNDFDKYRTTPMSNMMDDTKKMASYKRQVHKAKTTRRYGDSRPSSKAVFVYSLKDISKTEKDFDKNYNKGLHGFTRRQNSAQGSEIVTLTKPSSRFAYDYDVSDIEGLVTDLTYNALKDNIDIKTMKNKNNLKQDYLQNVDDIDTNEIQNEALRTDDLTRNARQKRYLEEEENTTPHESSKVYRMTDDSGLEIVVHLHNTSNDAENAPFQFVHVSEQGRCDVYEKSRKCEKSDGRGNFVKCCCSKCCKCGKCCKCNACNKCTGCPEPVNEATESIVIEKSAPVEICISVLKVGNTNYDEICKCLKCKNCKNKHDSESVVVLNLKSPKCPQSYDLIPCNNLWEESRKKEVNSLLSAKTSTMSPGMFLLHLNSNKTTTRKTLENEPLTIPFKTFTPTYKIPPLPQFVVSSAKKERTPHLCNSEKMSLNREFLNAINRQLLEIYKNLTSIQSQIRKTRNISSILDKIQTKNMMKFNKEKSRERRKIHSEEDKIKRSSFAVDDQKEPFPNRDFDRLSRLYDRDSKENIKNYTRNQEKNILIVKRNASDNNTKVPAEDKKKKFNDTNQLTTNPTIPYNNLSTTTKETKNRKEMKTEDQSAINKGVTNVDDKQRINNDSSSLHEDSLQELDNFTDSIQRLMDLIGCLSGVIVEEKNHNYTTKEGKRNGNYNGPSKTTHGPISTTKKLKITRENSITEENNTIPNKPTYAITTSVSPETTTAMELTSIVTKQNEISEKSESTTCQSRKTHSSDDNDADITQGPTTTAEVRPTIVKSNHDLKGDRYSNRSDYKFSNKTIVGIQTMLDNPSTIAMTSEQNRSPEPKPNIDVISSTVISYNKVTINFHNATKPISSTNKITEVKERKTQVKNKKRKDGKERSTKHNEKIYHATDNDVEQEKTSMLTSTTLTSSPLQVNTLPTTPSVSREPNTINNYETEEFKIPELIEWRIGNYNSPIQTLPEDNSTMYRNLLNSVFRYEMNLLKEEWERFLNRERGYDADNQKNIKDKSAVLFPSTERSYIEVIIPRLEQPTSTKRSLFHKIASKISRQHPRDVSKKKEKYLSLKSRSLNIKKSRHEETTTKKCKTKLYKLTKPHTTGNAESTTKSSDKVTTDRVTTAKDSTKNTTVVESTTNKEKTETDDDEEEQEEETSETTSTESTAESSTESRPPESETESTSRKTTPETSTATTTTTIKSSKDTPSHPIVIDQSGPPTTESTTHPLPDHDEDKNSKEACDPDNPNLSCVCDMRATHHHVLENYKKMSVRDFERYVRNVTCYRYKYAPDHFLLREYEDPYKQHYRDVESYIQRKVYPKKLGKRRKLDDQARWDWIRSRRSLQSFDYFETYTKSKDGVYERAYEGTRRKRAPDVSALGAGLRELPDFDTDKNELLTMRGDTLTLECQPASELSGDSVSDEDFFWSAEREGMLEYSNVVVEGETVTVRDVRVENSGEYKCFKKGVPLRALTLSVLALPQFHVVFLPAYDTERECRYHDLLTVNSGLAAEMEAAVCAQQKLCTVRVDEPSCVKSREGSLNQLRVTGVMSTVQHWGSGVVRCSAQCRRDLHCSLAYLCASAIPPLKEVDLVVAGAGHNRTLPAAGRSGHKWIVTHTLKRKDSNHHHEFHRLSARMGHDDVDMVLACPAGFYLRPKYKICVACPADTHAEAGANECSPCPRGWHAGPGAARCRNPLCPRPRRYDWGEPVCRVYSVVGAVAATLCLVGVVCGLRRCRCQLQSSSDTPAPLYPTVNPEIREVRTTAERRRSRPLSPSRVILARLFRFTPEHSSKFTDSQETKLDAAAETKRPPLPPPVDFDF